MTPDTDPRTDAAPEAQNGPSEAAPSGSESSARGAKVELDIDDAPFLEEPEEEKPKEVAAEPEKPAPAQRPKEVDAASVTGFKALLADKKKLAILIGALVAVLVVLPLVLMLTLGGNKTPAPVAHEPERIVVSGVPQREDAPPGPKFLYRLGGFFIERRGSEGELRFLRASFAIPTENPVLFAELGAKDVAVRDAIYYYLRNKPLTFLSDKESREMLKNDLLSVINEQISSEKVTELFFEEYLITGS
ncbi:MAG: flagellar basal body-associated FliL family protein [Desulfovibrionaceae bacterium]|nr:flagellar basal body-associated FliL family protein [Desulfovibrionaceae bacterium]